jgi:predicted RNase H-like nuclease (RuvC/YqgF family)
VIVELRNYTGVMVIDRNDELCVMYERASVQETVQKDGDTALARMEDQIRVLKIDVTDVQRSIEAVKQKCPEVPALDRNIATLQRDIMLTQREGRELEMQLEDPANISRWRLLPGRIKDRDELRIKVNQLEERLNHKKEQLLERDLILEEVCNTAL